MGRASCGRIEIFRFEGTFWFDETFQFETFDEPVDGLSLRPIDEWIRRGWTKKDSNSLIHNQWILKMDFAHRVAVKCTVDAQLEILTWKPQGPSWSFKDNQI